MSSLASPERIWWKPLGRTERLWVALAVLWALALFAMMIIWGAVAKQDTPMEFYRASPQEFNAAAQAFIQKYQVGTEAGVPVVRPPEGGDAYLVARLFSWQPILELRKGATYRLYLSSLDMQHGFSLVLAPFSLNFQVLPGYIQVVTLTPQEVGEFTIVCNEYCGIGHHLMVGKIIVKE